MSLQVTVNVILVNFQFKVFFEVSGDLSIRKVVNMVETEQFS